MFCLFLDASKAFDRVCHDKMFKCLINNGICPLILRIIARMYELSSAVVRWDKSISDSFQLGNGVREGSVLSPFLFSLYLNPLLNEINSSRMGCYIGNTPSNVFAYADDIVILAPTVNSLRFLTKILINYSTNFKVTFNPNKSFIIFYSNLKSNFNFGSNIDINGINFQIVKEGKHLGFQINNSSNIYDFCNVFGEMSVRTNVLRSNFYALDVESKIKLFNSQCMSLYGCELWNLEDVGICRLEITWRKCIKSLLGLPMRTRSKLLPDIIKCNDILTVIYNRQLNFYIRGLSHDDPMINFHFKNALVSTFSFAAKNINTILKRLMLNYSILFNGNKHKIHKETNRELWRVNMIFELCHMRDDKDFSFLTKDEIKNLLFYISTF